MNTRTVVMSYQILGSGSKRGVVACETMPGLADWVIKLVMETRDQVVLTSDKGFNTRNVKNLRNSLKGYGFKVEWDRKQNPKLVVITKLHPTEETSPTTHKHEIEATPDYYFEWG